jgi:branched-chain amino acid transport system substrate-binding protein
MEEKEPKAYSRREFLKIAGATGAAIGLSAGMGETTTTAGAATAGNILIGCPFPVTGWASFDAGEQQHAMDMFVKTINDGGGLLGRKVEYIIVDVADWSPEDQTRARDTLLDKGVDVFLPGWSLDPAFMDVFAAANVGGIPYIHFGTTELFAEMHRDKPDKYWNIIQTDDTPRVYAANAYKTFCKQLPNHYDYPSKTFAILTSDNTYNTELSALVRSLLKADPEWEIVVDVKHEYGATDFGVQMAQCREKDPGVIFFSTAGVPEAAAFTNQFRDNPSQSLVHIQYAPSSPEYRRIVGKKSLGILWEALVAANPTKEAEVYRKAYIQMHGEAPGSVGAWHQYDEAMAWAEAVKAVGDVKDYKGIVDYIYATPIKGFTWGPGGLNMCPVYGTDRTTIPPYDVLPPGSKVRMGVEHGSSAHYYQIQETSDGPQDLLCYMHGIPVHDYMMKYYGYPPQGKYIQELGKAEFQVPPWIKGA